MATADYALRQKVLELRAQGLSFGQIGERCGLSRSAVAGQLRRESKNPSMPPPPPPPPPVYVRGVIQTMKKPPRSLVPIPVGPEGIAFVDAGLFHCRWVVGRDAEVPKLVRFCGQPTAHAESSWCAAHSRLAYSPSYTRVPSKRKELVL